MTVRPKAWVCGRFTAGIASSNLDEGMGVRLSCLLCCVRSGLCDRLITRSEESYWVSVLIVCDPETAKMRRSRPDLGCGATEEEQEQQQEQEEGEEGEGGEGGEEGEGEEGEGEEEEEEEEECGKVCKEEVAAKYQVLLQF